MGWPPLANDRGRRRCRLSGAPLVDRGCRCPERLGGHTPVRVMPERPALLDQDHLRALVGHAHALCHGQGDGPLFDHSDQGRRNRLGLRRTEKLDPRTVGARRDGSGSGMLEQHHWLLPGELQQLFQIGQRKQRPDFRHGLKPPSSSGVFIYQTSRAMGRVPVRARIRQERLQSP